jgi:glycine cleavage system regulatory protein
MRIPLVMTIIARDRPGLVDLIAATIAEHDGNWLESRMAHLGGQFAGILRVHVPEHREVALVDALRGLQAHGLTVVVQADRGPQPDAAIEPGALLEIVGQDRPGIVRQISHALAGFGVNVEELQSECSSAPMSGETLFKARVQLRLPAGSAPDELRKTLERVAADLMVDVSLVELDGTGDRIH